MVQCTNMLSRSALCLVTSVVAVRRHISVGCAVKLCLGESSDGWLVAWDFVSVLIQSSTPRLLPFALL